MYLRGDSAATYCHVCSPDSVPRHHSVRPLVGVVQVLETTAYPSFGTPCTLMMHSGENAQASVHVEAAAADQPHGGRDLQGRAVHRH